MNAIPEGEVMRNTNALSTRILWFSVLAAALLLLPSRAAVQSATVTDDGAFPGYHLPACAPPSTCTTSPLVKVAISYCLA